MYRIGVDTIGFAVAGALALTIATTGVTIAAGLTLSSPILTATTEVRTPIVDSVSGTLILKGATVTAVTITGANVALAGNIALSGNLLFNTAVSKIIPGATSISLRNFADSANNLLITDAGAITVRSTITGVTALSIEQLTLIIATSKIVPGATSLSLRNNADNADNWILTDAGNGTLRGNLVVSGVGPHAIGGSRTDAYLTILNNANFTTGETNVYGFVNFPGLTPAANGSALGMLVTGGTFQKAGSGTHSDFATLEADPFTVGAGAAALTNATTLKISGAPSVGTNLRALWVTAGLSQFDGSIQFAKLVRGGVANSFNTFGLTLQQDAADDEILSLKSSDVAHGITSVFETDTYGAFRKRGGGSGGLQIVGISASSIGVQVSGIHTTDDTSKVSASVGVVTIDGQLKSGTSLTSLGANANILVVSNNAAARFILDADGDSHQDVGTAWTNFDEHDDVALLDAIAVAVARPGDPLRDAFVAELEARRSQIECLPGKAIVTFSDDGHHFVNMSRLAMLQHGAIRQLAARLSTMERILLQ